MSAFRLLVCDDMYLNMPGPLNITYFVLRGLLTANVAHGQEDMANAGAEIVEWQK